MRGRKITLAGLCLRLLSGVTARRLLLRIKVVAGLGLGVRIIVATRLKLVVVLLLIHIFMDVIIIGMVIIFMISIKGGLIPVVRSRERQPVGTSFVICRGGNITKGALCGRSFRFSAVGRTVGLCALNAPFLTVAAVNRVPIILAAIALP